MPPAVAIGAAIAGSAIATSATVIAAIGTIGAAVVGAVVSTGINILGNKVLGTNKTSQSGAQKDPGIMVNVQDNVASIPIVYGRRRVAGRQVYVATSGPNNKFLHLVFAIAEGPIQEIERIVIGNNEIAFDGTITPMTANSGSLPATSARGRFNGFASVEWRLGTTTQTAFTDLVSSVAGQEGAWTTDHRGLGVAMVHLKIAYDKEKMNSVPTVFFDIKGKKCKTFGGSEIYSDNPADALLDYLTNTTYGKGLSLNDIDQTSYNAVKNYCNETITLYTDSGSPIQGKRYLCNGYLDPDQPVFDNIKSILSCFNAYLLWGSGKYKFKVFKDEVNTNFTFDESNIIGEINMQLGSKELLANRVKAHFYNSGLDFAEDIAIYEDAELKDREDNGEWLEKEIALPFVSDYTRALMLAKQALEQSRRGTTISFQAAPSALEVEVGDRVWFSHPYLGFQDDYRVMGMILNPDKTVSVTLVQYDDDIYSIDDIANAPGPRSQGRTIQISGMFGVKPTQPTNINYFKFCPGAVYGIDEGYGIHCDAPTTGKVNFTTLNFGSSAVNIADNQININAHGLNLGDPVIYNLNSGTAIGGLTPGTTYYVIRVDANNLRLAETATKAYQDDYLDLTSQGTGTAHSLFYDGLTITTDAVNYYKFTVVTSSETKTFTAPGTTVVMPKAVWPAGTVTSISVQGFGFDGTPGEIGTSTAGIILNPDSATFCPLQRPVLDSVFQVCDGSTGVNPSNSMGTWAENMPIASGKRAVAGPGTSKWKVKWTGGPDHMWFTNYRLSITLSYNGTTFFTSAVETVPKSAGATEFTVEEYTMTSIATMPTFDSFDPSKDLVATVNVIGVAAAGQQSLIRIGDQSSILVNPDATMDCFLSQPQEVRYYQICNGTGGTDAAGTGTGQPKIINGRYQLNVYAQPGPDLNLSARAQRAPQNVDANVGIYIVHNAGESSYVNSYQVEFAVYKDNGAGEPSSTPSQSTTQTFAFNNTAFSDAQYNVIPSTVFNFNDAGNVWVDLRCRAVRTVAGVDYYSPWRYMANGLSGDLQNGTAPPSGESCF